jgi:hypothetical protein
MSHLETFCNEATHEQVNNHTCSAFFRVNSITHDDTEDRKHMGMEWHLIDGD